MLCNKPSLGGVTRKTQTGQRGVTEISPATRLMAIAGCQESGAKISPKEEHKPKRKQSKQQNVKAVSLHEWRWRMDNGKWKINKLKQKIIERNKQRVTSDGDVVA